MTDGIGRLSGYGNYGVGGYIPQRHGKTNNQNAEADVKGSMQQNQDTQLDPTKVMDFLANNTVLVKAAESAPVSEVDSATQGRISGYMENFELVYATVKEEFGEELAPMVMDVVMDRLVGMS